MLILTVGLPVDGSFTVSESFQQVAVICLREGLLFYLTPEVWANSSPSHFLSFCAPVRVQVSTIPVYCRNCNLAARWTVCPSSLCGCFLPHGHRPGVVLWAPQGLCIGQWGRHGLWSHIAQLQALLWQGPFILTFISFLVR